MFEKIESAIKEFEIEGGKVLQDRLHDNGIIKRRTVIVVTNYGGIHVLQSNIVLEKEEFNRVFLSGYEIDFLKG